MADEGFKRKLAAILSADVEGYSRLMDDDEEATVRTLTAYRTAIANLAQQFHGRIVDTPGDNILAEFASVVDAVNCAVEIQRELAERNAELPDNRRMEFRIGVNIGDVIEEEERIYGDGVNIAARVEAMAEAGGICISGRAFDHVENKLDFKYEDLGEHQVKNITRPIRVFRVLSFPGAATHRVIRAKRVVGNRWRKLSLSVAVTVVLILGIFAMVYWRYYYLPYPSEVDHENKIVLELPQGPSIAVLPFNNMSADSSQDYFCDGITENIIAALSHTPQLFVIARNSSFAYRGKSVKVQQIGHDLGAQYVLEGSIQKYGDRIRITVQLIETKTGHHQWSERFDRNLTDIFNLQDEIAIEIMKSLQVKLTEGKHIRTRFQDTTDLKIFIKLLKAYEYFRQFNKEAMMLALKEAEEVVEMDPENPAVYVLLGVTFMGKVMLGICDNRIICFGRATEAARTALGLDDQSSDAHGLTSLIFLLRKEYEKAIFAAKQAIILNPNNADAYHLMGYSLYVSDRPAEGIEYLKKAIRLNPIPPSMYLQNLGHAYRAAKKYNKAIEAYRMCIEREPENYLAHIGLAATYGLLGNQKEAYAEGLEILKLYPEFSIEEFLKDSWLKNQEEINNYRIGLQKAGLK